jgi:hypothetical protein
MHFQPLPAVPNQNLQLLTHRQAKQTRDKNRTSLATAYEASLRQIESRVQKAVAKHKDLR